MTTTAVPAVPKQATAAPTDTSYTLPGVSWLSLQVQGNEGILTVAGTSVTVQVTPAADGAPTHIEADLSQVTLASISQAAVAAGS
ncbi:MAG: hypothetical protein ACLGIA_02635, partial [Actinomycetes bacterium]